MQKNNTFKGIILILIGLLFLANNLFDFNLFHKGNLWPLIILFLGLYFEFKYFELRNNPGLLVPGGILTTIGLLFCFETFTNWHFAAYTWPIYILAVAIGLFQLYIFSNRRKGLLIAVLILTTIAVTSFLSMFFKWFNTSYVFPIILILVGLNMLFKNQK